MSQFISRGYEPNLPTFLTCIRLSTRGYSPKRPDAVISTNMLNSLRKLHATCHFNFQGCMNRHLDEIISLRMISFFQMLLNFAKSFSSIQFEVRTLKLVKFAPNCLLIYSLFLRIFVKKKRKLFLNYSYMKFLKWIIIVTNLTNAVYHLHEKAAFKVHYMVKES